MRGVHFEDGGYEQCHHPVVVYIMYVGVVAVNSLGEEWED